MTAVHLRTSETYNTIQAQAERGRLLHGTNALGLAALKPHTSPNLHIHDATGERVVSESVVCATEHAEAAIFYAAIRAVVRAAGVHRGAGLRAIRFEQGFAVGYEYFLSDRGKQVIETHEAKGGLSVVYFLPRERFAYNPTAYAWQSAHTISTELGSATVTSGDLPFDIYDLRPSDSDPQIRAYSDQFGIPPETPPL